MTEAEWIRDLFERAGLAPRSPQPPFVRTMPPLHPATDDADYDERRLAGYEAALGPADVSLRASMGMPAIDVHRFPPGEARPHWTWITSGMSDFLQDAAEGPRRTELAVFSQRPDEAIAGLLADLAVFPFRVGTQLGAFHSLALPEGMLPEGYAGVLFLPALHLQALNDLTFGAAQPLELLHVLPVTATELAAIRDIEGEGLRFAKALGQGSDRWLFERP
jgi:hypothetical protein